MQDSNSIARRRPKQERPHKLVVYLTQEENGIIERAAAALGRSKSAFGAEIIIAEARRILGKPVKR